MAVRLQSPIGWQSTPRSAPVAGAEAVPRSGVPRVAFGPPRARTGQRRGDGPSARICCCGRRDSRSAAARRCCPTFAAASSTTSPLEAADDAMMSVLARLDDFRGRSRFTTWAYKFALLEAAVKLRRRAWQGREVPIEQDGWDLVASADLQPARRPSRRSSSRRSDARSTGVLSPHQRRVLVALAVNGVPIDVLAERLGTTRGALYKTLHDARRKLRRQLAADGHPLSGPPMEDRDDPFGTGTRSSSACSGRREPELGCDACFDELDRYVDLQLLGTRRGRGRPRDARASRGLPGVPRGAREPRSRSLPSRSDDVSRRPEPAA